jgi:murein DD-endopeptidase MepM/ murein hydrolase activator NlpD
MSKASERMACWVTLLAGAMAAGPAAAETPSFGFPVACELGKTCFVQNHVDLDPTGGVRDHRCGGATYNGHKGTDFRLLSTREAQGGVPVLAAASGVVKGLRNHMVDRLIKGPGDVPKGRECGNGVVIDHGNGWETQYCHMRRGTIAVRRGQQVARGARLGLVGFSGKTEFAHLHFSVRHNGATVDPYTGATPEEGCRYPGARPLWSAGAVAPYAGAIFIEAGFTTRAADTRLAEAGELDDPPVTATSPALVFYARAINILAGDHFRLEFLGPGGFKVASRTKPVERNKANYIAFAGKRLRTASWPAGRYRGQAFLVRGDQVVGRITRHIDLR